MNLDSLLYCWYYAIIVLYNALPSLLHLCLHAIYQIVLIINLLSYFDLLTMKELMNLNNLPCCCHCAIILFCNVFPDHLHLCLHVIYSTVLIVSFSTYLDLPIIKKPINLNYLAYCLAYCNYLVCCLAHCLAYYQA